MKPEMAVKEVLIGKYCHVQVSSVHSHVIHSLPAADVAAAATADVVVVIVVFVIGLVVVVVVLVVVVVFVAVLVVVFCCCCCFCFCFFCCHVQASYVHSHAIYFPFW